MNMEQPNFLFNQRRVRKTLVVTPYGQLVNKYILDYTFSWTVLFASVFFLSLGVMLVTEIFVQMTHIGWYTMMIPQGVCLVSALTSGLLWLRYKPVFAGFKQKWLTSTEAKYMLKDARLRRAYEIGRSLRVELGNPANTEANRKIAVMRAFDIIHKERETANTGGFGDWRTEDETFCANAAVGFTLIPAVEELLDIEQRQGKVARDLIAAVPQGF